MSGPRRPALLYVLLFAVTAAGLCASPGLIHAQATGVESVPTAPPPPLDENEQLVEEISSSRVAALIRRFTYAAIILVLFLCGMGLPLPEEIPIVTSAVLAASGHLDPWWALAACMFGVLSGDLIMYYLGCRWGTHVLDHKLSRKLLTPERQKRVVKYFARYGARIIFIARFLPGIRAPIFLSAGTLGVSFWLFIAMDGGAAVLSIPLSFWLAYLFTDKLREIMDVHHTLQLWVIVALVTAVLTWIVIHWRRTRLKKAKALAVDRPDAAGRPITETGAGSRKPESAKQG
ncbi:MAG: DedA family protein [Planctomycetota bacterium]|nr:MAG: DedA family protein [Planctomycetota bacterium]